MMTNATKMERQIRFGIHKNIILNHSLCFFKAPYFPSFQRHEQQRYQQQKKDYFAKFGRLMCHNIRLTNAQMLSSAPTSPTATHSAPSPLKACEVISLVTKKSFPSMNRSYHCRQELKTTADINNLNSSKQKNVSCFSKKYHSSGHHCHNGEGNYHDRNNHDGSNHASHREVKISKSSKCAFSIFLLACGYFIVKTISWIDENFGVDTMQEIIKIHIPDANESELIKKYYYYKEELQRFPLIYTIIALNTAVFLLFRIPHTKLQRFHSRHMEVGLSNVFNGRIHTIITSCFSHVNLIHLLANMYVLTSFGPDILISLGAPTFLSLYIGSGILSSLTSLLFKIFTLSAVSSIGASGCIFGIVASGIIINPDMRVSLIFLPQSWGHFDPKIFFPIYLVAEIIFNLIQRKIRMDTAGHVGGALCGLFSSYDLKHLQRHQNDRVVCFNHRGYYYNGGMVQFRKNGLGILSTRQHLYMGMWRDGKLEGKGRIGLINGEKANIYPVDFDSKSKT